MHPQQAAEAGTSVAASLPAINTCTHAHTHEIRRMHGSVYNHSVHLKLCLAAISWQAGLGFSARLGLASSAARLLGGCLSSAVR